MQKITEKGNLLDSQGNLIVDGWARQPLRDVNLEDLNFYSLRFLQPLRTKRWQYYGITTPTHYFSFTLSHIGYLGPVFVYVLDFETCKYQEETVNTLFGRGVTLSRDSKEGECHYEKGALRVHFSISFRYDNKRFYYTRKINCMPVQGRVEYGYDMDAASHEIRPHVYEIDPRNSLGNLDWGVGVWPYRSFWIWGSCSRYLPDGRTLGLNLGAGMGNDPDLADNAVILNGRIHKISRVDFKYDTADFKKPWQMKSRDGRLELEFVPFFERVAKTDAVVLASEVHQMFSRYNGKVVMDDGEQIRIDGLIGWAEGHHARW